MQIKNLVVKYFYQASQSQGTEMHNTPVSLNALFKGISSTVSVPLANKWPGPGRYF